MASSALLTIPFAPWPSRNAEDGKHWRTRQRTRHAWAEYATIAWTSAGRPRFARAAVTVRLYFATARARDRDNLTGSSGMKGCLDGLKGRAFPDDADGVIDLRPVELLVDRSAPRVEVLIEPLDSA